MMRIFLCLPLALTPTTSTGNTEYRSSASQIVWNGIVSNRETTEEKKDAYNFLRSHVMPFDEPFLSTLGFHDKTVDDDVDGLSQGVVESAIHYSFLAKEHFPYTDALPKAIFFEYVLNYANVNEARNNVRRLLWDRLVAPNLLRRSLSLHETVHWLNANMWSILAPSFTDSIVFESGQTPAIFDPMSVIAFGRASCTGLSILFVQALRAAGIPSRVVGTPAWNGNITHGNHNWVEVYVEGEWKFLEPSPNQTTIDDLNVDPRDRWFCYPAKFNNTQVYAASLTGSVHVPLAWERDSTDVPGVNRTAYYAELCQWVASTNEIE